MASDVEVAVEAINTNGVPAQLKKAAEELIELALECMHAADGNGGKPQKIAEEVADVQFMLLQLKLIMDTMMNGRFTTITQAAYEYKVNRTEQIISMEKEKRGIADGTSTDNAN